MRIVFAGGGTAGHITPIVAVAEEIRRQMPGAALLHIGRKEGAENRHILRAGIREEEIPVIPFSRSSFSKAKQFVDLFRKSVKKSKEILGQFHPDLVFATGGYVSAPVLLAAKKMGIPIALHESNAVPGAALKLFWKRADFVFLAHPIAGAPKNAKVIGNPLPSAFSALPKEEAKRKLGIPSGTLLLLSYGGSGGAEKLNEICLSLMRKIKERESTGKTPKIVYRHATGRKYYPRIHNRYPLLCAPSEKCCIVPYIDEMPLWLSAADLAITRAGAMTLAELAATETPAILIPSPNVKNDHQTRNAEEAVSAGCAVLLPEAKLTKDSTEALVFSLLENPQKRNEFAERLRILKGREKNAAKEIVNLFINSGLPKNKVE